MASEQHPVVTMQKDSHLAWDLQECHYSGGEYNISLL